MLCNAAVYGGRTASSWQCRQCVAWQASSSLPFIFSSSHPSQLPLISGQAALYSYLEYCALHNLAPPASHCAFSLFSLVAFVLLQVCNTTTTSHHARSPRVCLLLSCCLRHRSFFFRITSEYCDSFNAPTRVSLLIYHIRHESIAWGCNVR